MNDALMLGGIITRQDFHFALNADEQLVWTKLTTKEKAGVKPDFAKRIEQFGSVSLDSI